MTAETKKFYHNSHPMPIALWESRKPTLKSQGGEDLLKTMKKIAKVKLTESKPIIAASTKKVCICAPTKHEGSFRCHLHRLSGTKKSGTDKKSVLSLNSNKLIHRKVDAIPRLSRFGRAACAEASHDRQTSEAASVDMDLSSNLALKN